MPSITYWSRLEPRPRAPSIADTLAARVRDPAWLLARQWQFGEFNGDDAGSPAFAQVVAGLGRVTGWSTPAAGPRPLPAGAALEPPALGEDLDEGDLSLAVELGQVFERTVGRPALIDAFRASYPVAEDDASVEARDEDARRLLQLAAGRVTHGVRLYLAAEAALPGLPADPSLDPGDEGDVRTALDQLRAYVRETVGPIGPADAAAWEPERLEYALDVAAREPANDAVTLAGHPDRGGRLEWHAFDQRRADAPTRPPEEGIERVQRSVIPASASFRGMPVARWWGFESGATNLAAVRPEKRELTKLIVLDFMLVHANDWYVISFDQPLGSLCRIESLLVRDVFGGTTLVERADRGPAAAGRQWTIFSTSVADGAEVAGFFLMAPTVGSAIQSGAPVEDVRFVRDEMANMAWGVERAVRNALGEPWPGAERSAAAPTAPPATPPSGEGAAALGYRIQTTVLQHWIPFLPAAIDAGRRDIMLERGVLLRSASEGPAASEPVGRILRPSRLAGDPYRLEEEELPRNGRKVLRVPHRSRWIDGTTLGWLSRHTAPGAGEERSGLQFDVAAPR